MRVLFVSHSLPPADRPQDNIGGMQRVAQELHDALIDHPDLTFVTQVLRSSWSARHYTVPPFMGRSYRRIKTLAEQGAIDAVLFSSMVTASLAVPLRKTLRAHGVATAAIVHGLDVTTPNPLYQRWVPRVFNVLDAVLPVSRATGAACQERGLPADKLFVVPNGVHLERFEPLQPAATMRRELMDALASDEHPFPSDGLLLCSVGRQVKRKGFARFVDEVMPQLPEDVHYWLAGTGPEHEAIRETVERRGLQERVRLLGRVSDEDLARLYRGADLFVMPNIPVPGDMEGFGVVMLEAGLSALPTVGSRLEGIQDVIREGQNGHLVEAGDAPAFARAITRYYRDRSALRVAARRAAAYTAETFSWPAVAERYVEVLRALVHPTETAPQLAPQHAELEPIHMAA